MGSLYPIVGVIVAILGGAGILAHKSLSELEKSEALSYWERKLSDNNFGRARAKIWFYTASPVLLPAFILFFQLVDEDNWVFRLLFFIFFLICLTYLISAHIQFTKKIRKITLAKQKNEEKQQDLEKLKKNNSGRNGPQSC